ncbi:MAG: PD-(D/E)XK nuclease family protein [Bacteroidales bacterium]|nr:PD-(D/E)XK nuclease family protein [Bacteroidales bacterium]
MSAMKSFLYRTAEDLYRKHGHHLNEITVVFPNQRARIFFVEHLCTLAGRPVWAPRFISIGELFAQGLAGLPEAKGWTVADPLLLCGLLFGVYRQVMGEEKESFDEFYGWGNTLLSDFDNIDKNCADARQIFRNISEREQYSDRFEHLSPEQEAVLKRFFSHFEKGETELKKRFIRLWDKMPDIYAALRDKLAARGEVYQGMLNRYVVEHFDEITTEAYGDKLYAFVGFNALNRCESLIFEQLQKAGKAVFYWDYDHAYLDSLSHEAGRFLRENLKKFPNQLKDEDFDSLTRVPKQVHFVASPTESAQAHYAGQWLDETVGRGGFLPSETAVVLCREDLLLPLLHCIPDSIPELNVTMGYPLSQTPVYNLLRSLLLLHCDGYRGGQYRTKFSLPLLQNPLIGRISPQAESCAQAIVQGSYFSATTDELSQDEVLGVIFQPIDSPVALGRMMMDILRRLADQAGEDEELLPLYEESLFQAYTTLNHLNDLLEARLFDITLTTYRKLALKVLNLTIPFSGEPLQGAQIMGMLETRNLDFRNVLMLSVNEGVLPQKAMNNSFIPYNLRRAFGLTGPEHQDAISAYYFLRFLQRAENITLVYNTSTEGMNRGEMSRFMRQLMMESDFKIDSSALSAEILQPAAPLLQAAKPAGQLPERLSPTAINTFLACGLQFYYKYILGLKNDDDISEEVDGARFGQIFHRTAQYLYTWLMLKKGGRDHSHEAVCEYLQQKKDARKDPAWQTAVHVTADDIRDMMKAKVDDAGHAKSLIEFVVLYYFQIEVFHTISPEGEVRRRARSYEEFNGEQMIQFKLLVKFAKALLKSDLEYAPFDIIDLEMWVESPTLFDAVDDRGEVLGRFRTDGYIDRIDYKDNRIRVIDYKTGGQPSVCFLSDLFECKDSHRKYVLQLFLYSSLLAMPQTRLPESLRRALDQKDAAIQPVIIYLHQLAGSGKIDEIKLKKGKNNDEIVLNYQPYDQDFRQLLSRALSALYDTSLPFQATDTTDSCKYCDFKEICQR